MKYENLQKATKMCEDIHEVAALLGNLRDGQLKVSIFRNGRHLVSHSPDALKEDYPEMPIEQCRKYVDELILHYSQLYSDLQKQLEQL